MLSLTHLLYDLVPSSMMDWPPGKQRQIRYDLCLGPWIDTQPSVVRGTVVACAKCSGTTGEEGLTPRVLLFLGRSGNVSQRRDLWSSRGECRREGFQAKRKVCIKARHVGGIMWWDAFSVFIMWPLTHCPSPPSTAGLQLWEKPLNWLFSISGIPVPQLLDSPFYSFWAGALG